MFKTQYPKGSVYFFLFTAYFVFNVLFPAKQGMLVMADDGRRIYAQVCLVSIIFYSLIYIIKNLFVFTRNRYFAPYWQYLLMSVLYMSCYVIFPGNDLATPFEAVVQILKSTAAIFVYFGFYLVARKDPHNSKYLYAILLLQVVYSVIFLGMDYYHSLLKTISSNADNGFDSNAGFALASLIPMCFILPYRRFRIYLYVFLIAVTIFSGQRTAALAAIISIPFALGFIKKDLKRFDYILFGLVLVVVVIPVISIATENIMLRNEIDANSGDIGSGRSEFWKIVITSYSNSNIFGIILGHGLFSVNDILLRKYGIAIGAHNGYIDHLYSFGIIGLFLYLRCYLVFYKMYIFFRKKKSEYAVLVLMMLFMLVLRSGASHGDFDISYIPFFSTMAIIIAKYNKAILVVK